MKWNSDKKKCMCVAGYTLEGFCYTNCPLYYRPDSTKKECILKCVKYCGACLNYTHCSKCISNTFKDQNGL